jgi:3,4-dihydroxy 2-butanone 4-phosphate synthase
MAAGKAVLVKRVSLYRKCGSYQKVHKNPSDGPYVDAVQRALEELRKGRMILLYDADGREAETDLCVASQFVTPEVVRALRTEAGGVICMTLAPELRERLGLPYLDDVLRAAATRYPVLGALVPDDLPYDRRSAFGVAVNHRRTFTGVTDEDRALTIRRLAEMAGEALRRENGWGPKAFVREFRAPGHVFLLNASHPLLKARAGHTELATALTAMAGLVPSATICEMMGDRGKARTKAQAKNYAHARNLVFLEGSEVAEAWDRWSG